MLLTLPWSSRTTRVTKRGMKLAPDGNGGEGIMLQLKTGLVSTAPLVVCDRLVVTP